MAGVLSVGLTLAVWYCAPAMSGQAANPEKSPEEIKAEAEQARREAAARLSKFKAELKDSKDPVGLAIPMAKDQWIICARAGLDVLLEHWEDPRSEQVLTEISKGEPKYHEDWKTVHGEAYERLLIGQARKTLRDLLKDKQSDKEKLAAIREFWDQHAEWLDAKRRPASKEFLAGELIGEALRLGEGDAVDLVVRSGFSDAYRNGAQYKPYIRKHFSKIIQYAQGLGYEKALGSPGLVDVLMTVKEEYGAVLPLLEGWLKEVKDDQKALIDELVPALSGGGRSQGKQRLLKLLEDPRPAVVRSAASWLSRSFSGKESLAAVGAAVERRKAAGVPKEELNSLEAVMRDIEKELAERKRKEDLRWDTGKDLAP